jgi:hypothetical protein
MIVDIKLGIKKGTIASALNSSVILSEVEG